MTCLYFHFWTITLVNINGFSPNLVCALKLWTFALGLLMGKFLPLLTELSAHKTSIFYFQDNNLCNLNGFSPNLVCALILWRSALGLLMQILSIFDRVICPQHDNGGV